MANSTTITSSGYNFKVVLLGEGCVGKTSLVLRYVEDKFNDKHISTLQVLFNILFYYICINSTFQLIIYTFLIRHLF